MFSSLRCGAQRASSVRVSRFRAVVTLLVLACVLPILPGRAATLERLTFDEMTSSATDIIYGQVLGSRVTVKNDSIYTHYSVQVQERWKGSRQLVMDVVLPGGEAGGMRQKFAGVPRLDTGAQYVMFLWTGASGTTQLLGLTQGLFAVQENEVGELTASRGVSGELMLDRLGKAVQDQAVKMPLREMSSRVKTIAAAKAKAFQ